VAAVLAPPKDQTDRYMPYHKRPAATRRNTALAVVQEAECKEIADQCVLSREQQSRPDHRQMPQPGRIALVADLAAIGGSLKAPVDDSEE